MNLTTPWKGGSSKEDLWQQKQEREKQARMERLAQQQLQAQQQQYTYGAVRQPASHAPYPMMQQNISTAYPYRSPFPPAKQEMPSTPVSTLSLPAQPSAFAGHLQGSLNLLNLTFGNSGVYGYVMRYVSYCY